MKVPLVCVALLLGGVAIAQDTTKYPTEIYVGPSAPQGMTMGDVIKLTRAGVKDDVIIQQLRANGKTFRLTSNDLIRLKNAGVSDRVVQTMISPGSAPSSAASATQVTNQNTSAANTPSATGPAGAPSSNPKLSGLPSEPGLFVMSNREHVKILGQPEAFERTGSRLVSGVTLHIKAEHNNIQLPGRHAQTVTGNKPTFAFVPSQREMENGVTAGDLLLIKLEVHGDRRQIEIGAVGAGRGSAGVSITHQLQAVRSEPVSGIYELIPSTPLFPGEYAVYLARGEGLPPLLFDFSVQAVQ